MADNSPWTVSHGAVVRGPRSARSLALIFTGGDFGEGTEPILDTLDGLGVPGAFFVTGGFLADSDNRAGLRGIVAAGHYLGPHSHEHLLLCSWDDRERTLVTREEFEADLERNLLGLERFGVRPKAVPWWVPPYEWYNREIADWAADLGHPLISFTPGTRSHADYTEEGTPNYRSSAEILKSIVDYEEADPDGSTVSCC